MKKFAMLAYIPSIIILFVCLFAPLKSFAEQRQYTYEVYAGGFHVVQAILTVEINDKSYDISVDTKTRGWLASLAPWAGTFRTEGKLIEELFLPSKHQSIATWRGETETKTFTYKDNNLISLNIVEGEKPPESPKIDPALTNNTTDILSATLAMMNSLIKTQNCKAQNDIFDGKRRFTMYFQDQGDRHLASSRYNIFSGPARLCTIEIEPKGGKWHKKPRGWLSIQEQGRQQGSLPSVWMGKVQGFPYALPVKIMVKTDYGTLMMHLTNVNNTPNKASS